MIFCFDIDGIICKTNSLNYNKSRPIKKNIKFINSLYQQGHIIKIFTARYMGRNRDSLLKAKRQGYESTMRQLNKWGLKFHKLFFGKPSSDIYIDDKNLNFKKNWIKDIKKKYIK